MFALVRNVPPYDEVLAIAETLGEACWLAKRRGGTLAACPGDTFSDEVWDAHGACERRIRLRDCLIYDLALHTMVSLHDDEAQRLEDEWRRSLQTDGTSRAYGRRWHGHKPQATRMPESKRCGHNMRALSASDDEIPVRPKADLRKSGDICEPYPERWPVKISKSWKDQSKRQSQWHRIADGSLWRTEN